MRDGAVTANHRRCAAAVCSACQCSSSLYFILLFAFRAWFRVDGVIALLALTFSLTMLTAILGITATVPRAATAIAGGASAHASDADGASRAVASSAQPGDSLFVRVLTPSRLRVVLRVYRWLCVQPSALFCLFLSFFLWATLLNAEWIDFTNNVRAHRLMQEEHSNGEHMSTE